MFGTDLESWDVILFNNKNFDQHLLTFVDFCWLKNQMKYRKSAIFWQSQGNFKTKIWIEKVNKSWPNIFCQKLWCLSFLNSCNHPFARFDGDFESIWIFPWKSIFFKIMKKWKIWWWFTISLNSFLKTYEVGWHGYEKLRCHIFQQQKI